MKAFRDLAANLSARSDLVLVIIMISIIFMMILPLPTIVVDGLIAINFTLAIILLMVSIYVTNPLQFSALPSVLLIATLFRLSLSVTTTRLILLNADAGKIIDTFGNFVVAGNLIVGLVIFLIITIVQFIVITKGSERVAEVSARFSLDGMPGKQMSIDSDVRSGMIDKNDARRRRENIEKETQLYGAMDGAMKFVKGDAIAGLIITAVNIIGGIAIGTLQRDLSTAEALQIYSVLTIGDGLVAQIPALLISIGAGILVTRVKTDGDSDLAQDIGDQVASEPRSLQIAGVVLTGFAFIPGFPTLTFIIFGAVIGLTGLFLQHRARSKGGQKPSRDLMTMPSAGGGTATLDKPSSSSNRRLPPADSDDEVGFSLTIPIILEVAANVQAEIDVDTLNEELAAVRRALYFDLGIPFPKIYLRFDEEKTENKYSILLNEVYLTQGEIRSDFLFVKEAPGNLDVLDIQYETGENFLPESNTIWVDRKYEDILDGANIGHMDAARILTYHLSYVLKKYASDFIGIQETQYLLNRMENSFGELTKEVQRVVPLQKIAEIFQRMVSEEISIRNLRTVLEALIEWGQKEKDPILLAEYVRTKLKRYITYKYSSGHNMLMAYLLTSEVEDAIRNGIRQTSNGSFLSLEPASSRMIIDGIRAQVGDLANHKQRPVLLTAMDTRRYLRKLIEGEFYELPVLSYQELAPEITVQPLGRIKMSTEDSLAQA